MVRGPVELHGLEVTSGVVGVPVELGLKYYRH